MPVFLANRANLQTKRLHQRLKHRLQTDGTYTSARLERTSPRDPGTYRVTAETDARTVLDDSAYPTTTARIEVGFELFTADPHEHYWLNWIVPDQDLLVGWHQDGTHPDLGPVHLQVNDGQETSRARIRDVHRRPPARRVQPATCGTPRYRARRRTG